MRGGSSTEPRDRRVSALGGSEGKKAHKEGKYVWQNRREKNSASIQGASGHQKISGFGVSQIHRS